MLRWLASNCLQLFWIKNLYFCIAYLLRLRKGAICASLRTVEGRNVSEEKAEQLTCCFLKDAAIAKRLCTVFQIHLRQFDSGSRLQISLVKSTI